MPRGPFLAVAALSLLAACGMLHVKEQQAKLDALCRVSGTVDAERKAAAPLVVVLVRQVGADAALRQSWQLADHYVLEGPGRWGFAVSAGSYGLISFQDLNGDLKLQQDEPYLSLAATPRVACAAGESRADIALRIPASGRGPFSETMDVAALQVRSLSDQFALSLTQVTAVGEIASLRDARFADAVAEAGLWRPYDFLFKGRPGIYMLQPYDAAKIPVLFVHGINGSPANFAKLIERLDAQRYQPWVYYYPSGASLAHVADHLAQTMRKLEVRHDFTRFVVVAHSMGGLVARGFLQRYRAQGGASVPMFVSIATPWDGHKAAQTGVKTAPAVVRVWIDMSPGSDYLNALYATDLDVPHHLFFAFRQGGVSLGEADDGAVTLASQLRPIAQARAARVEGFNETHRDVLDSQDLAARLGALLAERVR